VACPFLQKQYFREVIKIRSLIPDYQITIEATHHGPTSLNKPAIFVEIGSTALEWKDEKAAALVCDCLLRAMDRGLGPCAKVGIGLGGTHYPVKLNKLLVESEYGLAAVAAKHNLKSIDEYMLRQMIIKSAERVKYAIVDLKGLGNEKHNVLQLLEKTELEILKI
jgi:D-aminoacyl-tRNA deacylase